MRSRVLPMLLAVVAASCTTAAENPPSTDFDSLGDSLDSLARADNVPGFAAAVVRDQEVVWSHAFGFADRELEIAATPNTPYRLASVSKPIAATVLMQLVEEGRLDLDVPMSRFRIHPWFEPGGGSWAHYPSRYDDGTITVRHVLTHTSQSNPPGEVYEYNGNIFADLTFVIEDVTGQSYPRVLQERVFDAAGMSRTVPGQIVPWNEEVAASVAKPYALTEQGLAPATYPGFGLEPDRDVTPWNLDPAYRVPATTVEARRRVLGETYSPLHSSQTAAGVVATVLDLARFDIALDRGELVSAASRESMFTASRNSVGEALPYGLGWFVEEIDGEKVVWHYGWFPPTVSALYVKVPGRGMSFILLANSDGLSADRSWTRDGLRASPYARRFLDSIAMH